MLVAEDTLDEPDSKLIEAVFPTLAPRGRLVIIGPTSRENGTPNDVDELPDMAAMWIGWVAEGYVTSTLSRLQLGNPETLAIYAMASAKPAEVDELRKILGMSGAKIRENWFRIWTPLAHTIKVLRGDQ